MPPITPRWSWIGVTWPLSHAISMTSQSSQSRIGWRMYALGRELDAVEVALGLARDLLDRDGSGSAVPAGGRPRE